MSQTTPNQNGIDKKLLKKLIDFNVVSPTVGALFSDPRKEQQLFDALKSKDIPEERKKNLCNALYHGREVEITEWVREAKMEMRSTRLARQVLHGKKVEVKTRRSAFMLSLNGKTLMVEYTPSASQYITRIALAASRKSYYYWSQGDIALLVVSLIKGGGIPRKVWSSRQIIEPGKDPVKVDEKGGFLNRAIRNGTPPSVELLIGREK